MQMSAARVARVSGGVMLTEGRLVVGGGRIGGGAVQEMTRDRRTCMQRQWGSWWCRRRRDGLWQGFGDVDVLQLSWIKQEGGDI
jgi:hypothetical protein